MEAVPLTNAQKFIYRVLAGLGPSAPLLQLATCLRVTGPVDAGCFERAAAELVARYPVLCSRLDNSGGDVMQRQGDAAASVEFVEINGDTDRQADITLSARADEPLDLFRENPFRIVVARTGSTEAIVMFLVHHLFFDETAKQMLLAEYLHLALGDYRSVREVPRRGADHSFLAWAMKEQEMIADGTFARKARFWIDYLDAADPVLRLSGRAGDDPVVCSLSSVEFDLEPDQFQTFADRALRLGVTQFTLIANAIFYVLHDITDQDNIALSVVTDTRRPPFGRTIGQFAGTFPLLPPGHDVGLGDDSVRLVFKQTAKSIRNYVQNFCYSDQVGWLKERHARGYSMTDVLVDYVSWSRMIDLRGAAQTGGHQFSYFPLTARAHPQNIPYHGMVMKFALHSRRDALGGRLEYDSAVVPPRAADMVATALVRALTVP